VKDPIKRLREVRNAARQKKFAAKTEETSLAEQLKAPTTGATKPQQQTASA